MNNEWYVGDPCYIIQEDDWESFMEGLFPLFPRVIEWNGATIELWENGGVVVGEIWVF